MNSQEDQSTFRIFGLSLSREVNVLALAAFVFSLVSLGWQSFYLLRGPQLALGLNGRVNIVLYSDEQMDDTMPNRIVLLNTGVAFHNSGAVGYNAVVQNMKVRLTLQVDSKDRHREYGWVHFEDVTPGVGAEPVASGTTSANQLLVSGRDQVARQVSFLGRRQSSPLSDAPLTTPFLWSIFSEALEANPNLSLLFEAETTDGKVSAICELSIERADLKRISDRGLATVYCNTDSSDSSLKNE